MHKQTNKWYPQEIYVLQTKNEIADFQNCDDSKLVCPNPCKNNTQFDLVVSLLFIYLDLVTSQTKQI